MQSCKLFFRPSSVNLVILAAALVKFGVHLYTAPGYGYFIDELYTAALSRHLAFGYVDLPPLVPALMALSRALLGESLLAMHIVPALAGALTLVFVCLIVRVFGGRTFAVALAAAAFLVGPMWLNIDSIFAYDSIDQMMLAAFLYTFIRLLKSGNRRLWIALGLLAGLACLTKMTLIFYGPGFLLALLLSNRRGDLLTRWPWLGAGLCVLLVSPYLLWQVANGWPTLEYWIAYGTARVYRADLAQYFTNVLVYISPFLLPLWLAGLYRLFRRMAGVSYLALAVLFLATLALLFGLHSTVRLLTALFLPLFAAGAVLVEELTSRLRAPFRLIPQATALAYLAAAGAFTVPTSLPLYPYGSLPAYTQAARTLGQTIREFNGGSSYESIMFTGRLGWEELARGVADVFHELPADEQAVAGIFADWYWTAGAVDMFGPRYGLPHAVSGSLTYYLWGPGSSWDVMLIVTNRTNPMGMFFKKCEKKGPLTLPYEDRPGSTFVFVCREPRVSADVIWSTAKSYR